MLCSKPIFEISPCVVPEGIIPIKSPEILVTSPPRLACERKLVVNAPLKYGPSTPCSHHVAIDVVRHSIHNYGIFAIAASLQILYPDLNQNYRTIERANDPRDIQIRRVLSSSILTVVRKALSVRYFANILHTSFG